MKILQNYLKLIVLKSKIRHLQEQRDYYPKLTIDNVRNFSFRDINYIKDIEQEISIYQQLII